MNCFSCIVHPFRRFITVQNTTENKQIFVVFILFLFLPDVPSFNLCTFLLCSLISLQYCVRSSDLYIKLKTKQTRSVFPMNFTLLHCSHFPFLSLLSLFFYILPIFCSMCVSSLSFFNMEIVKPHNVVPSIHSQ